MVVDSFKDGLVGCEVGEAEEWGELVEGEDEIGIMRGRREEAEAEGESTGEVVGETIGSVTGGGGVGAKDGDGVTGGGKVGLLDELGAT